MSSTTLGSLGFAIIGGLIGGPVGFSIGASLGAAVFAPPIPDGPNIEGPRKGDTDITSSALGKTIAEHYGVTRSGGNVIYSSGLKEEKTVTENDGGGGKGGGPDPGSTTTYSYSSSFAIAFGAGPAAQLFRIWADGKLIYDSSSLTSVQNSKYKFRFQKGISTEPVDPLIAESINRRLQGLPDINEGSGPQSTYRTMADLITEAATAASEGNKRAAIYQTYLQQLNDDAIAGGGEILDYNFTPAYRDMCMIVFEDMPLEDFGNRIPNITAEIAWGEFSPTINDAAGRPVETNITQNSSDITAPLNGLGVDVSREVLVVRSGTRLRKFSASQNNEVLNTPAVGGQAPGQSTVTQILGVAPSGDVIARMTPSGAPETIGKISSVSLLISGDLNTTTNVPHQMTNGADAITYGASIGARNDVDLFGGVAPNGYYYVLQTNRPNVTRLYGGPLFTTGIVPTFAGVQLIGDGPVCNGGTGVNYVLSATSTQYQVVRLTSTWGGNSFGTESTSVNVSRLNINSNPQALNGQTPSSILYDSSSESVYALFINGSTGRIQRYNVSGLRLVGSLSDVAVYDVALTLAPPAAVSGLQRSSISNGKLVYANGTSVVEIDLSDGSETIHLNSISAAASPNMQVYSASQDVLFTWIGTQPVRLALGRNAAIKTYQDASTLRNVLSTICARTGMLADEYDVTNVAATHKVRGYTVGRPATGRSAMQTLLQSYFVEGIESDYVVKFSDQSSTPIRTISESELGSISGPTGDVSFSESRKPEYDIPARIDMVFTDQFRDYQQGATSYRRVSQPVKSMYSEKTQNIEVPIVFTEAEAADIAQRALFLSWLSRDTGSAITNWSHLDLDPGDVISVAFDNGRTITERINTATVGADLNIEMKTERSGDPVYAPSTLSPIVTGGVPTGGIITPLYTELFVLDIPLLEDFHDTGRSSLRFYTAIGADTTSWLSATLYSSFDASNYRGFDTANIDVTWGQCQNTLGAPRALWTTDNDNTLTVLLSVNNGDVASVTFNDIVNNKANRALILNPNTGVAELIQFQTVTVNPDNSVTLSNLTRGLRGTDYAVDTHEPGEYFLLVNSVGYATQTRPLEVLGSTEYFKAVSFGALLPATPAVSTTWQGRDLRPYAPSQVNRTNNGGDIDITWNRRTRIGGEWNMIGTGLENVPLNEDDESYQFFLIGNAANAVANFDPDNAATFVFSRTTTTSTYKITAAELTAAGLTQGGPINVAVAQISAQVGRGFISKGTLRT